MHDDLSLKGIGYSADDYRPGHQPKKKQPDSPEKRDKPEAPREAGPAHPSKPTDLGAQVDLEA